MEADHLNRAVAEVAADLSSSASELLPRAAALLRAARAAGRLEQAARAVCRAQPCMASIWNAAAAALDTGEDPDRAGEALERFERRARRGQEAAARVAAETLTLGAGPGLLRVVTWSASALVRRALVRMAGGRAVAVACGESRPGGEGRTQCAALAAAGLEATLYPDAAIAGALDGADAVLVGADSVAAAWFINKTGTGLLAAAAAARHVPVYVIAGRDKLLAPDLAARVALREGPAAEVWPDAPAGIIVRNPYFERVPLELAAAVLTDVGPLAGPLVGEACAAAGRAAGPRRLAELLGHEL